jgi:hypothetical protein
MTSFPATLRIFALRLWLIAGFVITPHVLRAEEGAAPAAADRPAAESKWLGNLIRGYRESLSLRRAQALLGTGDRDRAVETIAEMIRHNDELAGGMEKIRQTARTLNPDQLANGTGQVQRMLRDRPSMSAKLAPGDELFDWAARKFAGEDVPTRIRWQAHSSDKEADAHHHVPFDGAVGAIYVRPTHGPHSNKPQGSAKTFDELWAEAAYELHNIQSHRGFGDLHERAIAGKVTRREYILASARLEYDALLRTRAFYVEVYYPWAKKHEIDTDPENWRLTLPSRFEDWLAQYPPEWVYPWQVYGGYYDEIVEWRIAKDAWERAMEKQNIEMKKRERIEKLWNKLASRPVVQGEIQTAA